MTSSNVPQSETTTALAPPVCACVITYNGKQFLERCFRTLALTDYENLRPLLIDNGSTDDSGDYVRKNFPAVDVLRIFPNAGYPHGANAAIAEVRRRGAKYIVLMNDDIAILHPEWLREAVVHFESDPRLGMMGFEQVCTDDSSTSKPTPKLAAADYLGSAVMIMPVELFDRIGTFDEVYFVMAEDDDITARAQAAGYRTAILSIPVYHYGGGTNQAYSRKTAYLQMRNAIRFTVKNRSLLHALMRVVRIIDVACNPFPVSFEKSNVAHRRMRNSGNVLVNSLLWLRAVSWNLLRLPQTLSIRAADRKLTRAARCYVVQPATVGQLTY